VKEKQPANPHLEWLDIEAFEHEFQERTVTLMSPSHLRRELAMLHGACAPAPDQTVPPPPEDSASFEDVRNQAYRLIMSTRALPAPTDGDATRRCLTHLSPDEKRLLQAQIDLAQNHLRACRKSAPLFLVSPHWCVRMADTVYGCLYPARVKRRDMDAPE